MNLEPDVEWFRSYFAVSKATYRARIADVVLACPCTGSDLLSAYARGMRKVWMSGNLTIDSDVTIGLKSDGVTRDPFILIVEGEVHVRGAPRLHGLLYSKGISWSDSGDGKGFLHGAVLIEGKDTGNVSPRLVYDPEVLAQLTAMSGAYVPVPGSWRDF